jgi:hypothetical protein
MSDSTLVENVLDFAHGLPRVPGARAAGNHVREGAALSAVPGLTAPQPRLERHRARSKLWRHQRLIGANAAGVISLLRCLMTQAASAFFAR